MRYPFTNSQKEAVFYKYNGKCADCGLQLVGEWHPGFGGNHHQLIFSIHNAHIHHNTPISEGGKHKIDNWVLLCKKCHYKRHNPRRLAATKANLVKGMSFV
jgi:5-methylcytosine-specific restriction endonuclease McrA